MQAVLKRWWWLSALVLAVLLVKAWFVGGVLQDQARALAAEAADIDEERVEVVDGLDVRLTGFTDPASRDAAVAAVEELDSSWEVVGLLGDDGTAGGATDNAGTAAATTSASTTTAAGGSDEGDGDAASATDGASDEGDGDADGGTTAGEQAAVTIAATPDGGVVLGGTVGSEARRSALVDAANEAFGAERVVDELVVDDGAVGPDGGAVTVAGQAGSDAQRDEWLAAATAIGEAGGLQVVDELTVAPIDEGLNALFVLDPIEFDYYAATIRPASTETLDAAAAILNANPDVGPLRVVGHTDSDGPASGNQRLSQERAEAVVAYLVENAGVDAGRLIAEGRGESELKIDPETSDDDRQRNRRIEWELVE